MGCVALNIHIVFYGDYPTMCAKDHFLEKLLPLLAHFQELL